MTAPRCGEIRDSGIEIGYHSLGPFPFAARVASVQKNKICWQVGVGDCLVRYVDNFHVVSYYRGTKTPKHMGLCSSQK